MKKTFLFLFLILLSFQSSGSTECVRPVDDVWSSLGAVENIFITFSDDGSAIFLNGNDVTEGQINRTFSQVLAAQASGRNLRVRYSEENLVCPPARGTGARNDIDGIWIEGN